MPFDTSTKYLSTDKECSLQMVVPTKHQLLKHLQSSPTDCEIITHFKSQLMEMLNRYFPIHQMHKVVVLLDPKFKRIMAKMLTDEEINDALNYLKI